MNDFTLLFAAETILAQNIHPNVISTAELQVAAHIFINTRILEFAIKIFFVARTLAHIMNNIAFFQLRATFLSRIDHQCIWSALSYFCDEDNL